MSDSSVKIFTSAGRDALAAFFQKTNAGILRVFPEGFVDAESGAYVSDVTALESFLMHAFGLQNPELRRKLGEFFDK